MTKILFMGGGNMTRAIVTGLIQHGFPAQDLYVIDRNADKREFFADTLHTQVGENLLDYLEAIDILVLAIKPQGAEAFCRSLQPALATAQPLIISLLAGVTLASLATWLAKPLAMVRAMPNTPALIQEGASGLFANDLVSAPQKQQVETMMAAIGIYAWVEEERLIEAITALSGSGPAYYFYLLECMQQIAVSMGLPPEIARRFSLQTAYGATKMALKGDSDVQQLRAAVTSKKGATAAALHHMQANGLYELLEGSLAACRARAEELSRG